MFDDVVNHKKFDSLTLALDELEYKDMLNEKNLVAVLQSDNPLKLAEDLHLGKEVQSETIYKRKM